MSFIYYINLGAFDRQLILDPCSLRGFASVGH